MIERNTMLASNKLGSDAQSLKRKRSTSSFESSASSQPGDYLDSLSGFNDEYGKDTLDLTIQSDDDDDLCEKPFQCFFPDCSLRFTRMSDVHRHIKVHDKMNKPKIKFQCRKCRKRLEYTRLDSLKRHEKTCKLENASVENK